MTRIIYQHADGSHDVLEVEDGTTLMQAAVMNGVEGIVGECGGAAMCATCHVFVEPSYLQYLPPRNEVEDSMLDYAADERRPNSRLSCQVLVTPDLEGVILELPKTQV